MAEESANETAATGAVGAGDNATLPEFEFNDRLLLNVLAYSVMLVVGSIGNFVVLVAAYRQHVSPENQVVRTNRVTAAELGPPVKSSFSFFEAFCASLSEIENVEYERERRKDATRAR